MASELKVAIVTGAGTGVGKSAALALLREGYSVTLAGRRVEPLENTVTEAGPDGSKTLVVPTDVGRPDAVKAKALFAATRERFGRVDLLFNKAGISAPPILMEDLTFEQWQVRYDLIHQDAGSGRSLKRPGRQ